MLNILEGIESHDNYYCVHLCVCLRACVRAGVRACLRTCRRACVQACVLYKLVAVVVEGDFGFYLKTIGSAVLGIVQKLHMLKANISLMR